MGALAYGAFGLVLVSEVIGRFLFYATHVRIGSNAAMGQGAKKAPWPITLRGWAGYCRRHFP